MLKEAKRLHDMGFAIHWLKPKSKAPIDSAWTTGPRKEFEQLKNTYKHGFNMGVRLGTPSKVESGGYLAVIDCDVKSQDPKHLAELEKKLLEFFGDTLLSHAPTVASGRGNGSRHYYIKTVHPVTPKRIAQSIETVKVHMPSAKRPSRFEMGKLMVREIEAGYRLRPAWEISVMGEGQQVVLPPSIHPDSGKAYLWRRPVTCHLDIPTFRLDALAPYKKEVDKNPSTPFTVKETPDLKERLSPLIYDMLHEGVGVEDRSASLFTVSMAMVRAGYSDDEILSTLTNKGHFLGCVPYEHRKTNNRQNAADWVRRFTLRKARQEADAKEQFSKEVITEELSDELADKQKEELTTPLDWQLKLERTGTKPGAKPKNSIKNIELILRHAIGENIFLYDAFANRQHYGMDTPWGGKNGDEVKDIDLVNMKLWLSKHYGFEPNTALVDEVVNHLSIKNKYHPVTNWLDTLEWDGVPRIDSWLKDYMGAVGPEDYISSVSRKILVAMVARVFDPGIKYDHVLVLIGAQGIMKSTTLRVLAGDTWFSDAHMNIADKDGILAMQGAWIVELGELSSLNRAETNMVKEFITRSTDRIRVPYGKRTEAFPRQCVFIGTTNNDEFLKDETGNRRFWPVDVSTCKPKELAKIRDQLFAEAVLAYRLGEKLWLDTEEARKGALEEQNAKMESDIFLDIVLDFFSEPKENFNCEHFTMKEALGNWGPFAGRKDDRVSLVRAGKALRMAGFEKVNRRDEKGNFHKYWRKVVKDGSHEEKGHTRATEKT